MPTVYAAALPPFPTGSPSRQRDQAEERALKGSSKVPEPFYHQGRPKEEALSPTSPTLLPSCLPETACPGERSPQVPTASSEPSHLGASAHASLSACYVLLSPSCSEKSTTAFTAPSELSSVKLSITSPGGTTAPPAFSPVNNTSVGSGAPPYSGPHKEQIRIL